MPAHATNKTNLASVVSAIDTLESNIGLGTGSAPDELKKLCKALRREVDSFKRLIQGIV